MITDYTPVRRELDRLRERLNLAMIRCSSSIMPITGELRDSTEHFKTLTETAQDIIRLAAAVIDGEKVTDIPQPADDVSSISHESVWTTIMYIHSAIIEAENLAKKLRAIRYYDAEEELRCSVSDLYDAERSVAEANTIILIEEARRTLEH